NLLSAPAGVDDGAHDGAAVIAVPVRLMAARGRRQREPQYALDLSERCVNTPTSLVAKPYPQGPVLAVVFLAVASVGRCCRLVRPSSPNFVERSESLLCGLASDTEVF